MGRRRSAGAQLELGLGGQEAELGFGERWARRRGYQRVLGVDEVGRGPLAGPVVAAAVRLDPELERVLVEAGL
ncbi:MAG: hypothetical protein D6729_12430, partial [Deltaproteobacteria bacterium]